MKKEKVPKREYRLFQKDNINVSYKTYFLKSGSAHRLMQKNENDFRFFIEDMSAVLEKSKSPDVPIRTTFIDSNPKDYFTEYPREHIKNVTGSFGYARLFYKHEEGRPSTLNGIDVVVNNYSLSTLVHEYGHVIDFTHNTNGMGISHLSLFAPLRESYKAMTTRHVNQTTETIAPDYIEYINSDTEIFASTFHRWYYETYSHTFTDPSILAPNSDMLPQDAVAEKLYQEMPEVFRFYDRMFGQTINQNRWDIYNESLKELESTGKTL